MAIARFFDVEALLPEDMADNALTWACLISSKTMRSWIQAATPLLQKQIKKILQRI